MFPDMLERDRWRRGFTEAKSPGDSARPRVSGAGGRHEPSDVRHLGPDLQAVWMVAELRRKSRSTIGVPIDDALKPSIGDVHPALLDDAPSRFSIAEFERSIHEANARISVGDTPSLNVQTVKLAVPHGDRIRPAVPESRVHPETAPVAVVARFGGGLAEP
jgi:hypothetical protein